MSIKKLKFKSDLAIEGSIKQSGSSQDFYGAVEPESVATGIHDTAFGAAHSLYGDNNLAAGAKCKTYQNSSFALGVECLVGNEDNALRYNEIMTNYMEQYPYSEDSQDYENYNGYIEYLYTLVDEDAKAGVIDVDTGDLKKMFYSGAFASGINCKSTGYGSHAEGRLTEATNNYAHAEGVQCKASGPASHAEGSSATAEGDSAHAEGLNTKATAIASHAEGGWSKASGDYSHAEGGSTQATGIYSHSEGESAQATGRGSHAEGASTQAAGEYSHTEGYATQANYHSAHAEGYCTVASNFYSHAEGAHTQAIGTASHVQGRYNIVSTTIEEREKYAHIVGNGTSENNRSNAHTLDWGGNAWYAGKVTVGAGPENDMDVATKQYVDSHIFIAQDTEPDSTLYRATLWIDTSADGGLKYYNGSAWVTVPVRFS